MKCLKMVANKYGWFRVTRDGDSSSSKSKGATNETKGLFSPRLS